MAYRLTRPPSVPTSPPHSPPSQGCIDRERDCVAEAHARAENQNYGAYTGHVRAYLPTRPLTHVTHSFFSHVTIHSLNHSRLYVTNVSTRSSPHPPHRHSLQQAQRLTIQALNAKRSNLKEKYEMAMTCLQVTVHITPSRLLPLSPHRLRIPLLHLHSH